MRVAIAGFWLESVTFLPDTTGYQDFERRALRGDDVIARMSGTATSQGGMIDVLGEAGCELVGLIEAGAGAAAAASDDAYERYLGEIVERLQALNGNVDAVGIHLHGALATPTNRKADAGVLGAIRNAVGPDVAIACPMDYHANLAPESLAAADVVTGYRYSPHTDMWETGARAARLLLGKLNGEIDPVLALAKPNVVLPSVFSATRLHPLDELVAAAEAAPSTTPGLLDCSLFGGFAYADTPDTGMSALAVADGDADLAQRWVDGMAARCRELRDRLFMREMIHDVAGGVDRALAVAARADKPVCILEHADRMNDSTYVLRELIRRNAQRAYAPFMCDPALASAAVAAGAGTTLDMAMFGRSSPQSGGPIQASAEVLRAGPLTFAITGPLMTGVTLNAGDAALLRIGGVLVSVISTQWSAIDLDCFTQFDLKPGDFDVILLRSKTHFREIYEPMCAEVVIVDTPDWGPAELATLPYEYLPAGTYPVSAKPETTYS
ncbi:MAG: M81 family metallopeptidase [Alphaproteobacteria bacterium]